MNSIKLRAAGITEQKLLEVIKGYETLGVKAEMTDEDTILNIEISPENGYSLTDSALSKIGEVIKERLSQNILEQGGSIQEAVVELLKARGMKLATAESCTSGLISSKITEVSGASSVFDFGISAYSNEIKMNALNVSPAVIEKYGAVSGQTAAQMAIGAMRVSGADIGLSVTGVAGPEPSEGKPVGLIYLGMCDKMGLWVLKLTLDGKKYDREQIRERAANLGLDLLRRYLSFENFAPKLYRGDEEYVITVDSVSMFSVKRDISYPEANFEISPINFSTDYDNYTEEIGCQEKQKASSEGNINLNHTKNNNVRQEKSTFFCFIKKVLPWVGDSTPLLIRKMTALMLCVVSFAFSIWIVADFSGKSKAEEYSNQLYDEYTEYINNFDAFYKDENGVFKVFSSLYKKNNDLGGWISNKNLDINAPVMKSDSEYFYKNHNFYKKPFSDGSVYTDFRCDISAETRSKNIIIYGKNDSEGLVFGNLDNYLEMDYYLENPTITYNSLNNRGEYIIVSVVKLYSVADFNYSTVSFATDIEINKYINMFAERSLFTPSISASASDDLLTLVTDGDGSSRIMILAKRITDNDDLSGLTAEVNLRVK